MNRFKTIIIAFACTVGIQLYAGQDTPLHQAAEAGNLAEVHRILVNGGRGDVNRPNQNGETPLHKAAVHHHAAVVRELLLFGANPNARDRLGITPLLAPQGLCFDTMRALLEAGADPNIFYTSSYYRKLDVPTHRSESLLHRVIMQSNCEAVQVLLESGAKPDTPEDDIREIAPLSLAICYHTYHPETQETIIKKLIEYGATVDARSKHDGMRKHRVTPLYYVAERGGRALALGRILIAHGADVRADNNIGKSPLQACSPSFRKKLEAATRAHGKAAAQWAEHLQKHYGMPEAVMRDILLPCVMPEWQAKELMQAAQQKRAAARQRAAGRAAKRRRKK